MNYGASLNWYQPPKQKPSVPNQGLTRLKNNSKIEENSQELRQKW